MIEDIYDVTIIGGGPAGLYAAFYSGLREMKTKLIECQPQLGGKLHIYPEKMIWDVGGITPISGGQLIEQLVEQGLTFSPTVILNEKVESIARNNEGLFVSMTSSGERHLSKTVIMAIGSGIVKPVKLSIEGADRFEVTNLHYTVKSLKLYQDKTVVISGGGHTAIDWANELVAIAKKVYLIYRRNEPTPGQEASVSQLLNGSATCIANSSITKLFAKPGSDMIDRVELTNHMTGERSHLNVDEVIISHGYECDASLINNSPLPIRKSDEYYIAGNAACETSFPGLYAAGDIVKFDGKVNLIAGTFQDAANAVNKAKQFVQPDADKSAMVSSHNDILKDRNKNLVKQMVKAD